MFWALVRKTWMQNRWSLTLELMYLVRDFGYIATGPDRDTLSALQIVNMPFLEYFDPDDSLVTRVLSRVHHHEPGSLAQFLSDPQLSGGITDVSAAIVLQMREER